MATRWVGNILLSYVRHLVAVVVVVVVLWQW